MRTSTTQITAARGTASPCSRKPSFCHRLLMRRSDGAFSRWAAVLRGLPVDLKDWSKDDESTQRIMAQFLPATNAMGWDYQHQLQIK